MVGDSIRQDVEGALQAGMDAVLLNRSTEPHPREGELEAIGVTVVRSLEELPSLVARRNSARQAGEDGCAPPSGRRRDSC
jgi:FMN phosphatase YigB (HAD superfamily)